MVTHFVLLGVKSAVMVGLGYLASKLTGFPLPLALIISGVTVDHLFMEWCGTDDEEESDSD